MVNWVTVDKVMFRSLVPDQNTHVTTRLAAGATGYGWSDPAKPLSVMGYVGTAGRPQHGWPSCPPAASWRFDFFPLPPMVGTEHKFVQDSGWAFAVPRTSTTPGGGLGHRPLAGPVARGHAQMVGHHRRHARPAGERGQPSMPARTRRWPRCSRCWNTAAGWATSRSGAFETVVGAFVTNFFAAVAGTKTIDQALTGHAADGERRHHCQQPGRLTVNVRDRGMTRAPARGGRAWLLAALAAPGCRDSERRPTPFPIGLLLSYSGSLAANSINSERALLMAIEAANAAAGAWAAARWPCWPAIRAATPAGAGARARAARRRGRAVHRARTRPTWRSRLKPLLGDRTLILPSFATASNFSKPHSWFVMGAPVTRVACELFAQLRADGRLKPLVVADPNGYNSLLAFELTKTFAMPLFFLPSGEPSNEVTVQPILAAEADAYVLAALPPSASSLVYALAAVGALGSPARLYLSPTLHTPALLETIPQGMLRGGAWRGHRHGRRAWTSSRPASPERWQDAPLDDAYAFYDAGALRCWPCSGRWSGRVDPHRDRAGPHIVAVTGPRRDRRSPGTRSTRAGPAAQGRRSATRRCREPWRSTSPARPPPPPPTGGPSTPPASARCRARAPAARSRSLVRSERLEEGHQVGQLGGREVRGDAVAIAAPAGRG